MDRTDCRPSPNRHRCTHLRAKDEADGLHTCLFFSFFFLLKEKRIYMYLFPPFFFDGQPRRFQFHGRRRDHLWSRSRAKKKKILLTEESKVMRAKIIWRVDWISLRYVFFSSSSPLPSRRLMTRARKLHSRQVRCQQTRCDYMRGEKKLTGDRFAMATSSTHEWPVRTLRCCFCPRPIALFLACRRLSRRWLTSFSLRPLVQSPEWLMMLLCITRRPLARAQKQMPERSIHN